MFTSVGLSALNGIGYVAEGFDRLKTTSSSIPRAIEGETTKTPFQGFGRKVREREAQRTRQEEDSRRRRATTIMSTHWNYSNPFPCERASAVVDDSGPSGRASVSNATDAPLSGAHVSSYQTPYQIQHEWAENVARAKEQFRILVGCNEVLDVNGDRIRAQLRNLEGRRSELEFSVSGLISHQNELVILNSTAEADLFAVKTSLEDIRAQHGHVEVAIQEARDQLARTTEAATDHRVHLHTLQVEAERFQAAIDERTSQLATVGKDLRTTQADVDRTRAALASDKAQLAATQVELRSVKDATTKENKQTEEALIERKRMWASIDRARADLEKVQASAVEERADAKRRLDDLRADIAKAGEKKEAKKKELAEYIAEGKQKVTSINDEVKKARAAHGAEITTLEKKIAGVRSELQDAMESLSTIRRDFAHDHRQLQGLRAEVTAESAHLATVRHEAIAMNEARARVEADLATINAEYDDLVDVVSEAERDLQQIQAAREEATRELYGVQEQIKQEDVAISTLVLVRRAQANASTQTELQDTIDSSDRLRTPHFFDHDTLLDPANIPIPGTPAIPAWMKSKVLLDVTQSAPPPGVHSAPITPPSSPTHQILNMPRTRNYSAPVPPQSTSSHRMHTMADFRLLAARTGRDYPRPRMSIKIPLTEASAQSVETNLSGEVMDHPASVSLPVGLKPPVELTTLESGLAAVAMDMHTDSSSHPGQPLSPTIDGTHGESEALHQGPYSPLASETGTDDTVIPHPTPTNAGMLPEDSYLVNFTSTIPSHGMSGMGSIVPDPWSSGTASQSTHTMPVVESTTYEKHTESYDCLALEGLPSTPTTSSPVLRQEDRPSVHAAERPDIPLGTAPCALGGSVQASAHNSPSALGVLSRSSRRFRESSLKHSGTYQHGSMNAPTPNQSLISTSSGTTTAASTHEGRPIQPPASARSAQPQGEKSWWSWLKP